MEPNPNEGMVLRVDFDVDGDGQTDLLLANGQTMGSSGFAEWFVYRAKSKGVFQFIGSFVSAPKSFRVLTAPSRIEDLAISRDDNDVVQSTINNYSVSATAVTHSSSVPTDSAGASAERNKINYWQAASGFRLLAAALDAQGRFMNAVWIEAGSNQPAKNARYTKVTGLPIFLIRLGKQGHSWRSAAFAPPAKLVASRLTSFGETHRVDRPRSLCSSLASRVNY
jgi:hypothetical protein